MTRIAIAILAVALGLGACAPQAAQEEVAEPPRTREVTASSGTDVPLVLLSPLTSGGSKEGDEVVLMVAEDVVADGLVVVPAGTPAKAEVTWSRGASVASQFVNQPARLAISLPVLRIDGRDVPLVLIGEERYEFTQANTVATKAAEGLEAALADATTAAAVNALIEGELSEENLRLLTDRFDLPETKALLQDEEQTDELSRLLEGARKGDIASIAAPQVMLAVSALQELGGLASSVDRGLRGKIKGSNINALVGTRLELQLGEDLTRTVPIP